MSRSRPPSARARSDVAPAPPDPARGDSARRRRTCSARCRCSGASSASASGCVRSSDSSRSARGSSSRCSRSPARRSARATSRSSSSSARPSSSYRFVRTVLGRRAATRRLAAALRPDYDRLLAAGTARFCEPRRDDLPALREPRPRVHRRHPDLLQHKPGRFTLERCRGCGHVFQNPRLSLDGLDFYYRDFYDGLGEAGMELVFGFGAAPVPRARRAWCATAAPRRAAGSTSAPATATSASPRATSCPTRASTASTSARASRRRSAAAGSTPRTAACSPSSRLASPAPTTRSA